MFILKATMSTVPITNLQASASAAQTSFSTALLLPHGYDCKHAAADIANTTTLRELQKLLGEDPTKMSRVNTKVVVTSILRSKRQIVTACASTTVPTNTLVDFDVEDQNEANVPFLHSIAQKLGIILTSRECLEYAARYNCNAKLHYFAFGLLNQVHASSSRYSVTKLRSLHPSPDLVTPIQARSALLHSSWLPVALIKASNHW
jgi:hypothetical protein